MEELWELIAETKPDFKKQMSHLEESIHSAIPTGYPSSLYHASTHLINQRGKRIRPALVLLSYDAINRTGRGIDYIEPIAVGVELIHSATIIHDDIIDKSSMRRGTKTVNARWGDDTALLAGDLVFSKAFGLIGTHKISEVTDIISKACMKLAEGEVLESMHTGNTDMTEEVYLEIVERKTGALFEASTKSGAIVGEAREEEIRGLSRYGLFLGTGFQMKDDLLDVVSKEPTLGKPVGIDFTLGKPTFVFLHALRNADDADRELLQKAIKDKNPKEFKKAVEILESYGSLKYAKKRSKELIQRATKEIKDLKESDSKKALELIADYAIKREF